VILKAYELVPEAYRQKFRNLTKQDSQTYIEFAGQKEALFDRWCAAKTVEKDFNKLKQLMLVEEFKKCLHSDVKMYLDEQKVDSLHQAVILADEYCSTHKSSLRRVKLRVHHTQKESSQIDHSLTDYFHEARVDQLERRVMRSERKSARQSNLFLL